MHETIKVTSAGAVMQHGFSGKYFGVCSKCSARVYTVSNRISMMSAELDRHSKVCQKRTVERYLTCAL